MKKIFKYNISETGFQQIPSKAKILSVQNQFGKTCIWVLVDPEEPTVERQFVIYGTGHSIAFDNVEYIGTVQELDGELIWHIFEVV